MIMGVQLMVNRRPLPLRLRLLLHLYLLQHQCLRLSLHFCLPLCAAHLQLLQHHIVPLHMKINHGNDIQIRLLTLLKMSWKLMIKLSKMNLPSVRSAR